MRKQRPKYAHRITAATPKNLRLVKWHVFNSMPFLLRQKDKML